MAPTCTRTHAPAGIKPLLQRLESLVCFNRDHRGQAKHVRVWLHPNYVGYLEQQVGMCSGLGMIHAVVCEALLVRA